MDGPTLAAFVALALCIPIICLVAATRLMYFMNLFTDRSKRDKPPRGGTKPLGGDPHHLP